MNGVAEVECAFENPPKMIFKNVSACMRALQSLGECVELQKVKHNGNDADSFDCLSEQNYVVNILLVFQESEVDHFIFVNASCRLIIDSAEMFPVVLIVERLKECGGSDVKSLQVGEIR